MKSIIVITPTTGSLELIDAVRSVSRQSLSCHHLLVVDGVLYSRDVDITLKKGGIICNNHNLFRCDIPFNTGGGGYYGHRIMAGFGHFIPSYDYVLFLDQDNWYDPEHVESLVTVCERSNLDWAYSFRKIYSKDKEFLMEDNCESLGKWPAWVDNNVFLIDTSSYCFKTSFFSQFSHLWDYGWGADRRFFHILKNMIKHTNYDTSYKHTLCYRLGGNEGSVQKDFFEQGNNSYLKIYNGELPWKKRSL